MRNIGAEGSRRRAIRRVGLTALSGVLVILAGIPAAFAQSDGPTAEAKKNVAELSKPVANTPDLPPVDAAKLKGKSIFYISAGLSFPFSQEVLSGVKGASEAIGMSVSAADASGDSSKASSFIDRAIGQHASAIVLQGIDPYTVEASISDAKRAGIAVVSTAALPAGPIPKDIEAVGLSGAVNFSVVEVAKGLAAYVAANADSDAHIGLISSSTFRSDAKFVEAFTQELGRLCPNCKISSKDAPLMQWQTTLPSLARTMVTVDPKLSYIVPSVDAMVPAVKPAVIAAGGGDRIKIVSNNASLPDMQAIATKKDQEVADIGASNERMGWATVDQIVRALSGQPTVVDVQPLRLFTLENIDQVQLSQPAATWYGFDFKTFYRKLWGV
jgi:ribose transport system substrate-binding protein